MEKHRFKPYDREHMRMAMLRHEATFKEQVINYINSHKTRIYIIST